LTGLLPRIATAVVIAALLIAGVVVALTRSAPGKPLSADFTSTVSLYPGAHVEVLGVTVGTVTSVAVQGTHVHVEMSYDPKYQLPADVHAAIVPPSIVGDRYVQLSPAYDGGPTLPDNANLGVDRTAVPLELDQTYQSLNQLATALGPSGANANGALSRLLTAAAQNLRGNGAQANSTLHDLSQAVAALANSGGDIAGTVTNLSQLTQTLAADDPQVRALVANLAAVSSELNGERGDIGAATTDLTAALNQVAAFIKDNKGPLTADIAGLSQLTGTLAAHQRDLTEMLDLAPLGLTNLADSTQPENYDPADPGLVVPQARTAAAATRGNFFEDLPTQLGFTVTALCGVLPAAQQLQLAPLCTALRNAGGQLGQVLSGLLSPTSGGGLTTTGPATSLRALLLGGGS
jgi:virulence factor Mce-like protein